MQTTPTFRGQMLGLRAMLRQMLDDTQAILDLPAGVTFEAPLWLTAVQAMKAATDEAAKPNPNETKTKDKPSVTELNQRLTRKRGAPKKS